MIDGASACPRCTLIGEHSSRQHHFKSVPLSVWIRDTSVNNYGEVFVFLCSRLLNKAKLSLKPSFSWPETSLFSLQTSHGFELCLCARKQNTFCVYSASEGRLSIGIRLTEGCVLLEPSLCSLAWENGDRIRVGTASCLCVCSCAALLMQSSSTCSMVCIQSKHDFTGNKCVGFVLKSFLTVRQGTFIHFP